MWNLKGGFGAGDKECVPTRNQNYDERAHERSPAGLPDFDGTEVWDDRVYEILPHNDHPNWLPVGRVFAEQQTNGLER